MSKFLQILCYMGSFVLSYWAGNFMGNLIPIMEDHYRNELGPDHPLPTVVTFFINNHRAVPYLFLFPWLFFVGLPLLSHVHASYWETNLFLLRFSIFITLEVLVLFYLSAIYYLPYWTITGSMSDQVPPLTWFEILTRGSFWLFTTLLLIALFWRIYRAWKASS